MLTAEWEQKLELIAKGNMPKHIFINDIKNYTKVVVAEIKKVHNYLSMIRVLVQNVQNAAS